MGPNTVSQLGDNFGAVGGLFSGIAKAGIDNAQAHAIDVAGQNASAQANEREDQIRRQGRQVLGEQVADTAESGIGFTQTTQDSIDRSAANVSLDALNARYAGEVERTNYINQAGALRAQAAAAPLIGAVSGATKALQMMAPYLKGG